MSVTFLDASQARLLLGPMIKLSKFLLGSILLYWINESLINALNNSHKVKVFTERSGIIFDLNPDIEIVFVDIFERFDDDLFQEFIDKFDNFRKQVNQNYKGSEKISY